MFDLADILKRIQQKQPVSPEEFAWALVQPNPQSRELFIAFLIANNPGSMNDILRNRLGYTHELEYQPNPAKLARICQMIIDRGNEQELQSIIQNFQLNLAGLSPQLMQAIKQRFNEPFK